MLSNFDTLLIVDTIIYMQSLTTQLEYIGCSESEAKTFLSLLEEVEGCTVQMLSKKTNILRPTLYGYINTLISKGLVKKSIDDAGARYFAESPEHIADIFDERGRVTERAKLDVLSHVRELRRTPQRNSHHPRLFFYDQPGAAEEVLRDMLRSRTPELFWFWPIADMLKVIPPAVFGSFHEERVRRNMHLRVLWPKDQVVNIAKYPQIGRDDPETMLREIRVLPDKIDTLLGYGMYGSRVGFIGSSRESYAFILDSKDLSETLRQQFLYWWQRAHPLKQA